MVMTGHSETGRVLLDCDGPIAFVTLSHPGRLNAISVSMWRELRRIFTELGANADLRCVVLRGEGGNFAAGADIREFPRERADRDGVLNYHLQVIAPALHRSEEHTSELQSLMRISYAVFCLKKKNTSTL